MIYPGRHLGFFRICHIGMTQYFYKWFRSIFYPENIGVDTKIMILCQLEEEILPKLDFHGGYLKKMAETHIAHQCYFS